MSPRPCSLLLAAHGSLANQGANQPLLDLADAVAIAGRSKQPDSASRIFEVVSPAFLNGQPALTNVLDSLPIGDVVVVPMLTSEGYYLKSLHGKIHENQNSDAFRVFMTPIVGTHHSIPRRVGQRISALLAKHKLPSDQTTVVVVGHGTHRNKTSGQSTIHLTEKLAASFEDLKFETAFLDQSPDIADVAANIKTRHVLVIPFLISRGPHSTLDVPRAFGLPSGPDIEFPIVNSENGFCICDTPVGMYPDLADVCLELADQAISSADECQSILAERPPT